MVDTLKALEELWERITPKGPRIDERTLIFATLDCFALCGGDLEDLERTLDKEIYWSQYMDEAGIEETITILNPPEFEMPKMEFKFNVQEPMWANSSYWLSCNSPMIISGIV